MNLNYEQQYARAETWTCVSLECLRVCLLQQTWGVTDAQWHTWWQWAVQQHQTVTLRLLIQQVEVDTTSTASSSTHPIVHYYSLCAIRGNDMEHAMTLMEAPPAHVANGSSQPLRVHAQHYVDLNITWMMQQYHHHHPIASNTDNTWTCCFSIDRTTAMTPRRNAQVDAALDFWMRWNHWMRPFYNHPALLQCNKNLDAIVTQSFRTNDDPNTVVAEHHQALARQLKSFLLSNVSALSSSVIVQDETTSGNFKRILFGCRHGQQVARCYQDCIHSLETLLKERFQQALWRRDDDHVVTMPEFDELLKFQMRCWLQPHYAPKAFAYPIRRNGEQEDSAIEGMLTIESSNGAPIDTMVRKLRKQQDLQIPLNAGTTLSLSNVHVNVHGWLLSQFGNDFNNDLALTARARQFCGFALVIGTLTAANELDPRYAMLVQNKDDLRIPLLLEVLPSAKAFQKATQSLSPEQHAFCKAYRALQLESSLLGVVVIPLQPQLERVLNLAPGSLTKEITLRQDLIRLLLEYQVSSDMFSFEDNGNEDILASPMQRLATVKAHVKAMWQTIEEQKRSIINETEQKKKFLEQTQKANKSNSSDAFLRLQDESLDVFTEHEVRLGALSMQIDDEMRHQAALLNEVDDDLETKRPCCLEGAFKKMSALIARQSEQVDRVEDDVEAASCDVYAGHNSINVVNFLRKGADQLEEELIEEIEEVEEYIDEDGSLEDGHRKRGANFAEEEDEGDQIPRWGMPRLPPSNSDAIDHQSVPETDPAKTMSTTWQDQSDIEGFTQLPLELDAKLESLDDDHNLCSTKVALDATWTLLRQQTLVATRIQCPVDDTVMDTERKRALDFLDAVSRSGSLPIFSADMHVIVATTHCFCKDLMETILHDNVNPLAELQQSTLFLASTVHRVPASGLWRRGNIQDNVPRPFSAT